MNKVSLICTIKNEKETIKILLDSIMNQTKYPDEIIIVDGGSVDGTIEIIRNYIDKIPINLIVVKNVNIAEGRNIAIKNAVYNIIASTDGGCKLDKKWFENIIKPFEEKLEVDIVSGIYLPWYENEFEEIVSYLIFPNINKLKSESFLPSGRSMAFKKSCWEKVGGYPIWLKAAEDTFFDIKLLKAGSKFTLVKEAIVYWKVRKNNKEVFKQFYNYSKGDGFALLFPQRYLTRYIFSIICLLLSFRFWIYTMFWFLFTCMIFTILWIKHLKKVKKLSSKRLLIALYVSFIIELGVFLGYLIGFFSRLRKSIIYKLI